MRRMEDKNREDKNRGGIEGEYTDHEEKFRQNIRGRRGGFDYGRNACRYSIPIQYTGMVPRYAGKDSTERADVKEYIPS
jgi:hypothetical protein